MIRALVTLGAVVSLCAACGTSGGGEAGGEAADPAAWVESICTSLTGWRTIKPTRWACGATGRTRKIIYTYAEVPYRKNGAYPRDSMVKAGKPHPDATRGVGMKRRHRWFRRWR